MDIWNPLNWFFYIPLLLLSTTSIAIILERAHLYYKTPLLKTGQYQNLLTALRKRDLNPISDFLNSNKSSEIELVKDFLLFRKVPNANLDLQVELRAREIIQNKEERLDILGSISGIATLIGLFGTVTGMIWSFSAMSSLGRADPAVLSGGIAQALITTAAGLTVAIPSLAATSIFRFFLRTLTLRLEFLSEEMIALPVRKEVNEHGSTQS